MARKLKYKVELNNQANLERLMQEIYTDANTQIKSAQEAISNLVLSTTPEEVVEHTMVAKEKGNLMKIKDSAIKIKLDIAKIKTDIIKTIGDTGNDIVEPKDEQTLTSAIEEARLLVLKSQEQNNK